MSADEIEAAEKNNARVLADGGPRLSSAYSKWVVARDRTAKKVLLGGLGGFGIGRMWINESESDDWIGHADAPEEDWATSQQLGGGASRWPA